MSIFDKRVAFKPFEYDVIGFKNAISNSFWLVGEWNFISDVQDFKVNLSPIEKNAIKNALLAISQIEISVKKFWVKLGEHLPKAEFDQVGITFGESEVRHSDAYSHLLTTLGLNDSFIEALEHPVIQGRVEYLTKYLKNAGENSNEKYTLSLALFSIFIENVSLFSQFLIIKSFYKYKNFLKDIDNVVQATAKEELVHALFGIYLINLIKKEFPEWFDKDFEDKIIRACKKAYAAEEKIIDWIFELGELDFISKDIVKEFTKDRFNQSLVSIGIEKVFEIDLDLIKDIKWFDEEISLELNTDIFHKKSVAYSKKTNSIKAEELF